MSFVRGSGFGLLVKGPCFALRPGFRGWGLRVPLLNAALAFLLSLSSASSAANRFSSLSIITSCRRMMATNSTGGSLKSSASVSLMGSHRNTDFQNIKKG